MGFMTDSWRPVSLSPCARCFLTAEERPGQENMNPENAPGLSSSSCVSGRMLNCPVKEMF